MPLLARAASFGTYPPADWQAQRPPRRKGALSGHRADLMPALQGEALGARLKDLETRWLASDLTLSRERTC